MPGVPGVYYGSEWGIHGDKKDGDEALRPFIKEEIWNELTEQIRLLNLRRFIIQRRMRMLVTTKHM